MRFDDAIPAAAKVMARHQRIRMEDAVLLRDAVGQLALFLAEDGEPPEELKDDLRAALGPYGRAERLVMTKDDYWSSQVLCDPTARVLETPSGPVRVVDRLLVGADWLTHPRNETAEPPRVVFTSFKGGVGRSTALTVTAAEWARKGKNVLVFDLDLEAPGLGALMGQDRCPRYGAIDYLVDSAIRPVENRELDDFVATSPVGGAGLVHVIPAVGTRSVECPKEFVPKLSRAMAEHISDGELRSAAARIEEMVARFAEREPYDLVLIDTRAGLAEMAAGPLLRFGAYVLLFGTDQQQTLEGFRFLFEHLASITRSNIAPGDHHDWRERLKAVHAKAALSGNARAAHRERLWEAFSVLYDDEVSGYPDPLSTFNFDIDDDLAPHYPLIVPFDPRLAEMDLVRDLSALDPAVYAEVFKSFLDNLAKLVGVD